MITYCESSDVEVPKLQEYPLERRTAEIRKVVGQLLRFKNEFDGLIVNFVPADVGLSLQIQPKEFETKLVPMLVNQLPMLLGFPVELEQDGISLNIKFDKGQVSQEILTTVENMRTQFGDSDCLNSQKVLSVDAQNVPYLQSSYTLIQELLEQVGEVITIDSETELGVVIALPEIVKDLLLKVGEFPGVLAKSADAITSYVLADYLKELCLLFNTYYSVAEKTRKVVGMPLDEKAVYAKIFRDVQIVLKKGFSILNMEIPEKM